MKKFLTLLFALLMPFCFLFGCADEKEPSKSGLEYKNGILEYEYEISNYENTTGRENIGHVTYRISTEVDYANLKLLATFYYYDDVEKKEKFLYREPTETINTEALKIYYLILFVPLDAFTSGKTIYSTTLEIIEE